ncbi:MAG TPA: DUF885 domain-containing protein [Gemmatimonadaceae bacterium]|nr:DUF885 domain-containing protein [Gemmatimonadaceae bacterium]
MKRRTFVQRAVLGSLGFGALRNLEACATAGTGSTPPDSFTALRDRYFLYQLQRNPVTSTYLGGDAYDASLRDINSRLRDYSPSALAEELQYYTDVRRALAAMAAVQSPVDSVDRSLMDAQLGFLIHQLSTHYEQRAVDTYVAEPFRGIDWQIQQMTDAGNGLLGTEAEWQQVVNRALATPAFLSVAKANLVAGKQSGNMPDKRMVQRDGINGSKANAEYFRTTLATTARGFIGNRAFGSAMLARLTSAGAAAAQAWDDFAAFLSTNFNINEAVDRFPAGEAEYEWRVRNILRDPRSAAQLFQYGKDQVDLYTNRIYEIAKVVASRANLGLSFDPAQRNASVRAVMDYLSKESPKNDDELFAWYRQAGDRAVAYGRQYDMFDIPATYRLDVVPTPPVLRSTIDAAYYPAPPFKKTGVGRFYLTPTDNDPAALKANNRASVADTAVHEGFPGHDWHYKYMTLHADQISNIRWLTPGAVEDSSSMWSDSMAAEGWALYCEELMSDARPNRPYGFYDAGEYLYELQGQLLRAVRIVVDVGIHTRRMTYDEAVDYFTEHVDFFPGARQKAASDPAARAAADVAQRAIYRYSKWPTQAITYNLGKNTIADLREAYKAKFASAYSEKRFHQKFMGMGTVPVAYFRDVFLQAP